MRKIRVLSAMIMLFSSAAGADSVVSWGDRVLPGSDLSGLVKTAKEKI